MSTRAPIIGYIESPDGTERIEIRSLGKIREGWTFHAGQRIPGPKPNAVTRVAEGLPELLAALPPDATFDDLLTRLQKLKAGE